MTFGFTLASLMRSVPNMGCGLGPDARVAHLLQRQAEPGTQALRAGGSARRNAMMP
jgi:hypothetical protein